MNKKTRNNGVFIDVALVILVLAVFSSVFASGFFARYRSGGSGDSAARVAEWTVDSTVGARIDVADESHRSVTCPVTFVNLSETAARYDVVIEFGQSVAGMIESPRLDGAAPSEGAAFTTRLSFPSAAVLPASDGVTAQTRTLDLTFTVPASLFSSGGAGEDYDNDIISGVSLDLPYTVTVTAVQID